MSYIGKRKNATSIEQCQVVETKNILSVCYKVIEAALQRDCWFERQFSDSGDNVK